VTVTKTYLSIFADVENNKRSLLVKQAKYYAIYAGKKNT
jgi:hypothetical protein